MTVYDELVNYFNNNGDKNKIQHTEKGDYIRRIELESLGENLDTMMIEFDFKNRIMEICLSHGVERPDELSIYRKISKANMIIDDGIIVYLEGKLVLRNISFMNKIDRIDSILAKLSYLQIVAITYFTSILSESSESERVDCL